MCTTKSYYSVINYMACAIHCILMTYFINGTLYLSVAFIFFTFFAILLPVVFPHGSVGKEYVCNVGDLGLIPGLGRSPGEGNGNPLQYYCLENPHGQRCPLGYSPWSYKESDMTE